MRSKVLSVILLIWAAPLAAEEAPPTIRVGSSWSGYPAQLSVATEYSEIVGDATVRLRGLPNQRGFEFLAAGSLDVLIYSPHPRVPTSQAIQAAFGEDAQSPRSRVFGQFVVFVIVHPSNPVRTLTYEQLREIYSGNTEQWSIVGGGSRTIVPAGEKRKSKGEEVFHKGVVS